MQGGSLLSSLPCSPHHLSRPVSPLNHQINKQTKKQTAQGHRAPRWPHLLEEHWLWVETVPQHPLPAFLWFELRTGHGVGVCIFQPPSQLNKASDRVPAGGRGQKCSVQLRAPSLEGSCLSCSPFPTWFYLPRLGPSRAEKVQFPPCA